MDNTKNELPTKLFPKINNISDYIKDNTNNYYMDNTKNELPAKLFPNINIASDYINENVKNNTINYNDVLNKLHIRFLQQQEYPILMGYNWYSGIVIADINKDGIYELFINGSIGSGIIHSFIHCYDPVGDKYYIISNRFEMDYVCFVYNNNIYVYGGRHMFNNSDLNVKIFKLIFLNDELVLEEINNNLYNEIIMSVDFENIYRQFLLFDEVRFNDLYQR